MGFRNVAAAVAVAAAMGWAEPAQARWAKIPGGPESRTTSMTLGPKHVVVGTDGSGVHSLVSPFGMTFQSENWTNGVTPTVPISDVAWRPDGYILAGRLGHQTFNGLWAKQPAPTGTSWFQLADGPAFDQGQPTDQLGDRPIGPIEVDGTRVLVGWHDGGGSSEVRRSTTNGATFGPIVLPNSGPQDFDVVPGQPQTVFAATDAGLYRSNDGGASFPTRATGIVDANGTQLSVRRVEAQSAATIWVATPSNGIFRSTNGGVSFSPRNGSSAASLSTGRVHDFLASPLLPNVFFAATDDNVWATVDSGATWYEMTHEGLSSSSNIMFSLGMTFDLDQDYVRLLAGTAVDGVVSMSFEPIESAQTEPVPSGATNGFAQPGTTLTVDTDQFRGTQPIRVVVTWERCKEENDANSECEDRTTGPSYSVTAADRGHYLRARMLANGVMPGLGSVTSTNVGVPGKPEITVPPAVFPGTPSEFFHSEDVGTVTKQVGTQPVTITRQWQRCSGPVGTPTCGATGDTGINRQNLTQDVGRRLRIVVTASNAHGSATATSAQSNAVLQSAPAFTTLPSVPADQQVGRPTTGSPGVVRGSGTTVTMVWRRCATADTASCVNATGPGVTTTTYTPSAEDVGHQLRLRVTAVNAAGSVSAHSQPSNAVAPVPTSPGGGTPDPGTGSPDPGTGSPDPGTGSPAPGTGSPAPGTGGGSTTPDPSAPGGTGTTEGSTPTGPIGTVTPGATPTADPSTVGASTGSGSGSGSGVLGTRPRLSSVTRKGGGVLVKGTAPKGQQVKVQLVTKRRSRDVVVSRTLRIGSTGRFSVTLKPRRKSDVLVRVRVVRGTFVVTKAVPKRR